MELRHLRYFIAVAEELHFTRAAERLHIAQPPLSQQIRDLEDELGVALFERTRRSVRLTSAGTRFLQRARQLLADAKFATEEAKRAGRGEIGELRIGFSSSLPMTTLLPASLHDYRERFPDVSLNLSEMFTQFQFDSLLQNQIDIGLARFNGPEAPAGIAYIELRRDPLRAILHERHPLAAEPSLSLLQLAGERFITYPAEIGTGLNRLLRQLCRQVGFEWQSAQVAAEAITQIGLVAAGMGIAILPSPLECVKIPGVRYIPLRDEAAYMALAVVTRENDPSPLVKGFLECVLARANALRAQPT